MKWRAGEVANRRGLPLSRSVLSDRGEPVEEAAGRFGRRVDFAEVAELALGVVEEAGAGVRLRGNGRPQASIQDANGDGILDLVAHVSTEALQLTYGDTEAVLEARYYPAEDFTRPLDAVRIRGSDTVRVVP